MPRKNDHLTIREFSLWLADQGRYSVATRETYTGVVRRLSTRLRAAGVSPYRATTADLNASSRLSPRSPATVRTHRQAMTAFYTFLGVNPNPAEGMARARYRRGLPRPLEPKERTAYLKAAREIGGPNLVIAMLGVYGGLRASEAASLPWNCVTDDTLIVTGKGGYSREVPIAPALKRVLDAWRQECESPAWVFPSKRLELSAPIHRHTVLDWHHENLRCAKLKPSAYHRLRHTAATGMYEASGQDLLTTRDFLGHKSVETTAIYAKVKNKRMKECVQKMFLPTDSTPW